MLYYWAIWRDVSPLHLPKSKSINGLGNFKLSQRWWCGGGLEKPSAPPDLPNGMIRIIKIPKWNWQLLNHASQVKRFSVAIRFAKARVRLVEQIEGIGISKLL